MNANIYTWCVNKTYQISRFLHFSIGLFHYFQLNPLQAPSVQTSIWEDEHGNLDGEEDTRLTLFIASSSIIILSLITIIGVVSCFILCTDEPVSEDWNNHKPVFHKFISSQIYSRLHQICDLNYMTLWNIALRSHRRLVYHF